MHSKVDAAGTDECAPDDGQSCPKPERTLKEVKASFNWALCIAHGSKNLESTSVIYEFGDYAKLGSFVNKNGNFRTKTRKLILVDKREICQSGPTVIIAACKDN